MFAYASKGNSVVVGRTDRISDRMDEKIGSDWRLFAECLLEPVCDRSAVERELVLL